MALQTSGAISLANIQAEFGGSNPIGLNEYYGAAAGIPTSGTISLSNFYGKSSSIIVPCTDLVITTKFTAVNAWFYGSAGYSLAQSLLTSPNSGVTGLLFSATYNSPSSVATLYIAQNGQLIYEGGASVASNWPGTLKLFYLGVERMSFTNANKPPYNNNVAAKTMGFSAGSSGSPSDYYLQYIP